MNGQHRRGWWFRFGALVNPAVTDDAAGVIPGIEHFAIGGGSPVELRHYLAPSEPASTSAVAESE